MSDYMHTALEQAKLAFTADEVPVGAIIVERDTGNVLAVAHNSTEASGNPCDHAEIKAIDAAIKVRASSEKLRGCDLYVTLEPCAMCAGAISHARIEKLVFGAYDIKSGGVEHGARVFDTVNCHHKPEIVGGIMEQECGKLLREFFAQKR